MKDIKVRGKENTTRYWGMCDMKAGELFSERNEVSQQGVGGRNHWEGQREGK